jgi:hypothetical protein
MRWPQAAVLIALILSVTGCTTSCIVTNPSAVPEAR